MRALLGWGSTQGTPIPTTSPGAVQVPAWWQRDTKHHPPPQHRHSLHCLRHNWVSDTPAPPRSLSAHWRYTAAPTGAGRSWRPGGPWRPGGRRLGTTLRIVLSLGGCEPPTQVPAAPRPSIQHPWEASWWDWTPDSGWTPGQGEGLDVQERPISGRQVSTGVRGCPTDKKGSTVPDISTGSPAMTNADLQQGAPTTALSSESTLTPTGSSLPSAHPSTDAVLPAPADAALTALPPVPTLKPLLMLTECCTENFPRSDHRPQIPKSLSQDRTSASPALPISTRPCVASLSTRDSGLFPCQAPHKQHHLSPNLAGTPIPRAPSPGLLGVALTAAQTHPLPHPHSRHLLRD